jgi:hypothetical protein
MKILIIAFISILSIVFCSQQKPLDIICDIEAEDFAIKKWKSSHSKYNNLIPGYVVKYDTLAVGDNNDFESSLCNLELHFVPDFFEADKIYYNPNCLFSIVVGKNEFMFSNVLNEYRLTKNTLSHIFLKELYPNAIKHFRGAEIKIIYNLVNKESIELTYTDYVSKSELEEKYNLGLESLKLKVCNSYNDCIEMSIIIEN